MTMTLRCTFCNQTMAIAPRKPGSRLSCPSCGRSITVQPLENDGGSAGMARARESATAEQPALQQVAEPAAVAASAPAAAGGRSPVPLTAGPPTALGTRAPGATRG